MSRWAKPAVQSSPHATNYGTKLNSLAFTLAIVSGECRCGTITIVRLWWRMEKLICRMSDLDVVGVAAKRPPSYENLYRTFLGCTSWANTYHGKRRQDHNIFLLSKLGCTWNIDDKWCGLPLFERRDGRPTNEDVNRIDCTNYMQRCYGHEMSGLYHGPK